MQNYFSQGGTNALEWSLQGQGTKIIQLGVVSRNIHNSISVASYGDVLATYEMIKASLNEIVSL
ncbi:MAG: hypothetical protein HRS57_02520 [Mycoplasmataceae bacterium]|nr:hypothetical protein [Mycoplasmataceae bacterium]